ncbi:hypothetical protein B0H17DRAFT_1175941 [Mycena rosella]|uniref:HECT-type E3 ubiquitin transferase n=1 Tax=Mycena rosella TaxID=1033263 RepID=A0AAD7GQF2_MYCRO|nr:hypothetical protein B0H17DRAFT_1175941 [Mycena rosella]
MKILHKSKRAVAPPSQVAELIARLLNTPNDDLSQVLSEIESWKWPRSDLNAWIKVLNKFDAILEEVIRDYEVDKLQVNVFTPATKTTLCEILRFERLLLENSTNRKMFHSYDRLNSLLFTPDLDVLILALNLLLRPSQQYSAQPSVSHALNISTPRLQSLAKRWPHLREYGVSLVDLSSRQGSAVVDALPAEAREVHFSFYRTDERGRNDQDNKMDTDVEPPQSTPRKASTNAASSAVSIHIDTVALQSKSDVAILADIIDKYSVPETEKFELMCRTRAATVLKPGNEAEREKLVVVRLLAIAIFGHTHPETQATSSLFLYEPDLINHIAELLQIDKDVPVSVQTAAIAALDALAHYRNRIQEVLTAVNAGVNHGILMALIRKTVGDVANPDSTLPHSFAEALLSFVTFIASHASGGNMVVGAGLIPLLIQVIENRLPHRLPLVSKTMQLVDNVLYSFTNAFQLFCTSRGVDVLVDRIEFEIDLDLKEYGSEQRSREIYGAHGDLPVARAAILKHVLRSMHRMMQSSGTAEGLRGLIDMSILQSIKKIINYRGLFGPTVVPLAINIMATFIHNEPTSLAIIQEAGLPGAFYTAIEVGLEPAIEVIQAIPNAIGALCLNEVGTAQLASHPSVIPAIFSIFTSDRHLKILLDKENAVLIGTTIDELIRHHPSLKGPVFEALKATLSKIEVLGNAYVVPPELQQWYKLVGVAPAASGHESDVSMQDVSESSDAPSPSDTAVRDDSSPSNGEDAPPKAHDNNVVSFIDILLRASFLEGLFQHTPHCKDFITATDGLARLGRLTSLPCIPYDFANSVASDSMVQVMRTMSEVTTGETLAHLSKLVKESLDATKSFWEFAEEDSKLLPLVDITAGQELAANQTFRSLVTLHIRITLLSDVFATAGFAHGRAAIGLLQTFMSNTTPEVVKDLGSLHRATIWENIVLKAGLISKGIDIAATPSSSPLEATPEQSTIPLPDPEATVMTSPNGVESEQVPNLASLSGDSKHETSRQHNATALKHLTHGLPSSLAPFFQAMVKMFHARRNPDAAQKKQITESSSAIAEIMVKHLNLRDFNDKPSVFAYYTIMLGLITILLIDERTTSNTLHTVQVSALYHAEGLDAIFSVCQTLMTTIGSVMQLRTEDRSELQKQELVHAYGGLKVALHLIHPLISSKPLFDSGQTLLMITRDKKDTDQGYFDPQNFLIKLRLGALPVLRALWEAPWLISAPLSVSRSIVQTVLELTNGEGEEVKGEASAEAGLTGIPRPLGADEGRIRQLTDMGFPRSAAERALARTQNNLNAATDLLLSHPFPLPPDPVPGPDGEAGPVDPIETEPIDEPMAAEPAEEGDSAPAPEAEVVPPEPEPVGKGTEQWQKELDEAREPLRAGISRQALLLVDEHLSLIFHLHVAFIRPTNTHQQQAVRDLVDDIKDFSPFAYDVQEQPLANRCRLLALVLCETPSSLSAELRVTLMDSLLALLLSNPVSIDPEHPSIPRWLAAHLLVTEALFTLADEPRAITLPKEDEPIVPQTFPLVHSLPRPGPSLFVLLTRDHDAASQFVKRDGLSMLFRRLKASAVPGSSSYIATILRHIVEDPTTVQTIMKQAIKRYFAQPRTNVVEAGTYVRNCSAMALRDSRTFIDVTESLCQLVSPFSSSQHLKLKDEQSAEEKPPAETVPETVGEMQMDTSTNIPPNEFEPVVHFLIVELMRSTKSDPAAVAADGAVASESISPLVASSSEPPMASTDSQEDSPTNAASKDRYQYSCFLMQCLTELLFSYDSCKLAFLSYSSKKRLQTSSKEIPSKLRTTTLHFLLSDLISFETINPVPNSDARDRITVCNWAMSLLVALCVDTSSTHELKDVSPELVSVRKFVLEAISRAIKDLSAAESVEGRYGRLLALADLCHRLLTVRFNTSSRKHQDDAPTHIAKVMLEKNFVATLTTALSEVDLNYPNVRGLVASILRPLEYLTKIAIKMSRTSNRNKDIVEGQKAESVTSMGSEEDEEEMQDAGREETPDLYRNSALGMYGGEMEDVHFGAEDEMDEDEEDEGEDVDMDFGEETGSEDTSNTGDDGENDDLEDPTRQPGEVWDPEEDDEEDEEDEEDLVEHDEEEDEEEDEEGVANQIDGVDGDEGDEEMMWQDINAEVEQGGPVDEADDDEDAGGPIQIVHTEQEDEPEMVSEDEFGNDIAVLDPRGISAEDIFGFGDSFINANGREGAGFFVPRRHRGAVSVDDNVQLFGRGRNGPVPAPEATTHPLLLDASAAARAPANQPRNSRQPQRIVTGGSADLLQTLEDLIGGGAVQLFQHVMTRGRGGGAPETIRLDVPAAALGGFLQQRRAPGGISAAVRVVERPPRPNQAQAPGRDLDPLLTLQRWAEEIKILHGDFVMERVGKLANHVALTLLPAAVKAAKEAKILEEKDAALRLEAQAKAEAAAAEEEAAAAAAAAAKSAAEEVSTQDTADQATSKHESDEPANSEEAAVPPEPTTGATAEAVPENAMEGIDSTRSVSNDVDTDMGDATSPPLAIVAEAGEQPAPPALDTPASAAEGAAAEGVASSSETAGPSAVQRVTVMIHGSAVDITDTGIDPTFLEALPDDMREEVLNQHVRDQRASRVERPPDSQISSEFLDALPAEIRAEIIQQEAIERARRTASANAPTGAPAEIDPASFIATLDPTLRQAVLLDQDDSFIQTLPSHMIAEAGVYREGRGPRRQLATRSSGPRTLPGAASSSSTPRKFVPQHDAIQLLDKPGVAVLVRLLFFPQVLRKTLLFKVLVNLCENAKTRTELFNLLLNILQDGTGDLGAVDKGFAQMSFRNSKPQTPKSAGKQKAGSDYFTALALPNLQDEVVPDLIAQRCLEALTYIVSANELSSLFFLTEHELPLGLRRTASKKGKGKERQVPQTHYPIVLLLGLLDRQSLLKTPSIMESVVGLLATVTRPLASTKDKKPDPPAAPPNPEAQTNAPMSPDAAVAVLPNAAVAVLPNAAVAVLPNAAVAVLPNAAVAVPAESATPAVSESVDAPVPAPSTSVPSPSKDLSIEAAEERILLATPPQIPHPVLRLIVNILTIGECSGRTFQQSLALIQHLSYIPDARDIVAQELKSKAQEFGLNLYSDLDELAADLRGSQGDVGSVASKFSPASSVQAKLLRVLKTIDYMYSPKSLASLGGLGESDADKVQDIYESFRFTPLWRRLGDCLAIIEEKPDTEHIATVLLPLIEALMVVCKYVGSKASSATAARLLRASSSPKSPTTPRESMEDLFVTFTDAHRKVLNLMVRNNPSLMSGSFSLLVNNPRVLDFDNKRNYFTQQLHRRPHSREHHGTLQLNVRRARVFEDSFQHLQRKNGDQIKHGKLSVRFYDEEGVDAGGVTREWFQILARQMFDPNNALFQPCAADRLTYQPNKNSWVNPEHLSFFKFVGRVIGKAIYDGRLLDAYFARSLYRQLLGKPVDYKDVEWVDPDVEADEFGVNRIVPLKEGGETLPVTQENKREFVQLSAQYRLYSSIKDQIENLSTGFYEIIPKELITIFNEQELELLISGTPDIDVDEWRAATEYNGYTSSDPNIVWWWRALKSFNRDERAKVLSFATGTSKVPLGGFTDLQGVQGVQRFSIHRAYGDSNRLPQAHTCFNQIDLPQYSSYDMLRQQLLLAIIEGGEGFAFS